MMADFMDEDMGDDVRQAIVGLAPFIEQRAAIQKDHVRQHARGFIASHPDRMALIKPKNIPFAVKRHGGDHAGIGEILDAEQDIAEMLAKQIGQAFDRGLGEGFDIGEGGGAGGGEGMTGHGRVIGQRDAQCEEPR